MKIDICVEWSCDLDPRLKGKSFEEAKKILVSEISEIDDPAVKLLSISECLTEIEVPGMATPQVSLWISVKDHLPEYSQQVIVAFDDGIGVCTGSWFPKEGIWILEGQKYPTHNKISHWMPLPESPSKVG